MPWLNSAACGPNTRPTNRKFSPSSRLASPGLISTRFPSAQPELLSLQLNEQQLDVHKGSASDSGVFKESVQKWQQSSGSQFVSSWEPCLWNCSSLGGKQGQSAATCGGLWEPLTSDPLLWTSPEVSTSGGGRWCCRIYLYITRRPLLNCTAIQSRNCTFALRGTITFSCPHTPMRWSF